VLLPGLLSIFFTALSNKKVYIKIHSFSSIKTVAEKFSSKTMYTGSLYIHLGQCIQKIACIQIFFLFYVTKCKQLHWAFTSCSPGAWNHTEGMTARDQKGKRILHPSRKISLKLYSFFCVHSFAGTLEAVMHKIVLHCKMSSKWVQKKILELLTR